MFKTKVAALYFLLTVLAVVTVHYAVDEGVDRAEGALAARVSHGFEGFDRLRQLQQLSMHNAAFHLASSELAAHLRTLEDFRSDFLDLEREVYSRFPRQGDARRESEMAEARLAWVRDNASFVSRFVELLADRLSGAPGPGWQDKSRERFVADMSQVVVECSSIAMNKCFYRLTYDPLQQALARLRPSFEGPFAPDAVIVTDRRGVGWAHSQDPQWSDQESFAEQYPIVQEIQGRGAVDDLVQLRPDDTYHLMTGMGVYEGSRYVGAVLVLVKVDEELVDSLARTLGLEVTLVVGGKPVASSADADREQLYGFTERVLEALPAEDRYKRAELRDGGPYAGVGFYYHRPERRSLPRERAAFVPREIESLQVVLSVDQGSALKAFHTVKALLPLFGAFLFGLGVLFFSVLIRQHVKPFEAIDLGIHEVVSGNRDWYFKVDESQEELPRSMAGNLNLLVALLSGRQVQAEENSGAWMQSMMGSPGDGGGDGWGEDETPEAYRRRLYREFLDARRDALGAGGGPMNYEQFVELLARREAELGGSPAQGGVRFEVVARNGQITLEPRASSC